MDGVGWGLLLAGVFVWVLPVVVGVVASMIAVVVIGPRDRDSVILPGMAASASAFVALLETESWLAMVVIAAGVAFIVAVVQRWALARLDRSADWWPPFALGSAIVAGVLIGGFFGYLAGLGRRPDLIVAGAVVGGLVLAIVALRGPATEPS